MSEEFIKEVQEILTDTFNEGKKRASQQPNLANDGRWIDTCTKQIVESAEQALEKVKS